MYLIKKQWKELAKINKEQYLSKYDHSINNSENFWQEEGKRINWIKEYTKIKKLKYSKE